MNFCLIVLATYTVVRETQAGSHAGANAAEFREMCSFIQLLTRLPTKPAIKNGETVVHIPQEATQLMDRIRILNASTTDPITYANLEAGADFDKAKENPVVAYTGDKVWSHLVDIMKSGNAKSVAAAVRRRAGMHLTELHEKIGTILVKAIRIHEDILKIDEKIEADILAARKEMLAAAYGEGAVPEKNEKGEALTSGDLDNVGAVATSFSQKGSNGLYADQCTGDESKVGRSVVADITCLCGTKASLRSNNDLCKGDGISTLQQDTMDKDSEPATVWSQIQAVCLGSPPGGAENDEPTSGKLLGIVERHRALLGKGVMGVTGHPTAAGTLKNSLFILGKHTVEGSGKPTCTGVVPTAHSNGVCVDYSAVLEAGKEIVWVRRVKTAAEKLKAINDKFTAELFLFHRLETMQQQAENVFGQVWVSSVSGGNAQSMAASDNGRQTSLASALPNGTQSTLSYAASVKHTSKLYSLLGLVLVL